MPKIDLKFVKASQVRKYCNERGRRVSPDFLTVLDSHISRKLTKACSVHNGGKKTLDPYVAGFVGITAHELIS